MKSKTLTYKIFVSLLLGLAVFGTGLSCSGSKQQASLTFWSTDAQTNWQQIIADYQKSHSGVQIKFTEQTPESYEASLVDAMAAGRGPDIFSVRNDWLPRYADKIAPLDISKNYPIRQLQTDFLPVVLNDFLRGNNLYALPETIDVLVMYYNRALLSSAGIARPPATWPELISDVPKLTQSGANNSFAQSAVALGSSANVSRASEILSAIMLQSGVNFWDTTYRSVTLNQGQSDGAGNVPAARALLFYTQFSDPNSKVYTWNQKNESSVDAFAQSNVALLFGFGDLREQLQAKNAFLDYGIAAFPQTSTSATKTNLASYWGQTVWSGSKQQAYAWDFIKYASSAAENKTYLKNVSQPSARVDVVAQQQSDPALGVFADNALSTVSVQKPQAPGFDKIVTDAIDDTAIVGLAPRDAINRAQNKLQVLLQQYPLIFGGQ